MTFQEERLKVLNWYRFIRVQGRHNCSPAASFANCVMTLYLLKGICKPFFLQQLLKNAKFSVATFLSQMSDILFASSATFITFVLYTGIDKIINKLCRPGGGRQILANCFFFKLGHPCQTTDRRMTHSKNNGCCIWWGEFSQKYNYKYG